MIFIRAILAAVGTFCETLTPGPSVAGYRIDSVGTWFANGEAEQQLPDVPYTLDDVHGIPADRWYETPPAVTSGTCRAPHLAACLICGIHCRYQSPAASAGGAESSPPEVSAHPSAPSGERAWINWAIPAIQEVLAEHQMFDEKCSQYSCCAPGEKPHEYLFGHYDWREHVAPLIAERLDMAWRAKRSGQFVETGHDMGVSAASEFFPQSQKHRSK